MGFFSKKKKTEAGAIPQQNDDELIAVISAAIAQHGDDDLIAVISAAISAYESEQFVQKLYIQKINRAAGMRPIWGATGTNEAMDVRRI